MYCKSCGKKIDDDSKFCSFCGTKHNITIVTPEIKREIFEKVIRDETPIKPIEETKKVQKELITKKEIVSKYDLTYQKETDARTVGIILVLFVALNFIFGGVVIKLNNIDVEDAMKFYSLLAIAIRIVATIWTVGISKRQNRECFGWGVFAFLSPALALIIIGSLKKLNNGKQFQKKEIPANTISKQEIKSAQISAKSENLKTSKYKENIQHNLHQQTVSTEGVSELKLDENIKKMDDIIKNLEKYRKK